MPTSRTLLIFIVTLLVALVAGCGPLPATPPAAAPALNEQVTATEAATAAMIPLKVAVSPYLSNAAFYIALEEGFFAEQGLDIELVKVARVSDALPSVAQGDLDVVGAQISSALLNMMARESGIRIVASLAQEVAAMDCAYNAFVIRSTLPLTLTADIAPESLLKLRYGTSPSTPEGYLLDLVLGRYGLSIDDITPLDLGSAEFLAALQENAVDVALLVEPWITRARAVGAGDIWLPRTAVIPEAQSSVVVFGPSLLKDNPEAGMQFMVAFLKGVRQYGEGKTERNLAILAKHLELERDLLAETCFPQIPADGTIFTQSIEAFSQWAAGRDYIDRPVTADEFWDPRFVEQANAVLGQP